MCKARSASLALLVVLRLPGVLDRRARLLPLQPRTEALRRFQVQEKMTAQIADCIQRVLQPRGVGVVVEGAHECMTTRGVHKRGVSMVTSKMLGSFREDARTRSEFLQFIDVGPGR